MATVCTRVFMGDYHKLARLMRVNLNCCGSGPHAPGEVRIMPYTTDGNLILCQACWRREIKWRMQRIEETKNSNLYELPFWSLAKIYSDNKGDL